MACGPRIQGLVTARAEAAARAESCLRRALLLDEVKEDLGHPGTSLSVGTQQRLCIARALSTNPDVLLMDEPTASIDPIGTARIEQPMLDLRADRAIVVIPHSMMEARRIADRAAFFHLGRLLEIGPTAAVFDAPRTAECRRFIAGQSG